MTINYSCISDNIRRHRLPFGVPLEDIFPQRDLHPYLKKIFIKAFKDITSNGQSIENVVCKFQGNIAERLVLKEIVTSCKPMPLVFPPGALLWILRHFIGLLPVPLLPEYTNKEYFSWKRLSLFCKKSFLKYAIVETNNRLLIRKLAGELGRLPPANFLLFTVLLNFIRALSHDHERHGKGNFNRIAAFCLVRYFSSSLFIRPFVPGRNGKIDRHYFPLLFYLVLKWPLIQKQFGRHHFTNGNPNNEISKYHARLPQLVPEKIKIKDCYTQTENNHKHYDWLEIISEASVEESVDFLRDTACQTENHSTKREGIKYSSPCGYHYKEFLNDNNADSNIEFLKDTSCQTENRLTTIEDNKACALCGSNYGRILCENNFDSNIDFLRDTACQTENPSAKREAIKYSSPRGYDSKEFLNENNSDSNIDFLRDTSCQTENRSARIEANKVCALCGSNYGRILHENNSDSNIDFLRDTACQTEDCSVIYDRIRCCCTYGRNYGSYLHENASLDKDCQTNFIEKSKEEEPDVKLLYGDTVGTVTGGFDSPNLLCQTNPFLSKYCQTSLMEDTFKESTFRTTNNKRSLSTIADQELLLTDVGTNTDDPVYYGWVSPTVSSKSPRNKLDFCSPQTFLSENEYIYDDYAGSTLNLLGQYIEETRSGDDDADLLGRISKIGWTYTPPSAGSPVESPIAKSNTNMKEENYTLCFDDKEGRSREEKESCSSGGSLKSRASVGSAKSKKSFSITNLKNKLDFLKIFTGKKSKLKNSCSFSEISNIKYKKMNSVKSTLF